MTQLPKQYLRDLLKSILEDERLDPESKYSIREHDLRLWVSSIYRVTVHCQEQGREDLFLFFKCLPENSEIKETFQTGVFFRNEAAFYSRVLKPLLEFQEKKKVEDPFCAAPIYYRALCDGENDILVLEDLNPKGFIMLDRHKLMGVQELHLVMKELGRFHALSLAMKHQKPDAFSQVKASLEETVFCNRFLEKFGSLYQFVVKDTMSLLKENFSEDSLYIKKFEEYQNCILSRMMELVTPKEEDEPHNVITHADLWVNNFLFHYKDTSIPDAMKMLDFQASRYASPALDVSCVLLSSADKNIREKHGDALLHSYHDSLCKLMKQLGSDPEEIFPFEALQVQLKKYSEFGLWMTLFNLPHTLDKGISVESNKPDTGSNSNGNDVVSSLIAVYSRKTEECKRRLLEVIQDVFDKGYF